MVDVTIIGAGVVGGLIARTLSKYKLKICILEKEHDVATGASCANSAIVHAGFDAKEGTLKARLNVRGNQLMPELCRELGVPYSNNGALVVGFDEADRKTLEGLLKRGEANGVSGLRIVEREELFSLEPNLSDDALCALFAPTSGIVCPYTLAIAAVGNAMDNGAELKCGFCVRDIKRTKDGYDIFSETECVHTRFVVNAAGLFSDEIARMIGDTSFDVHARRGEYLLLDHECGSLFSRTIFRTPSEKGKGILISPTVHGNLLLGPTAVDLDEKENHETTAEGLAAVAESTRKTAKNVPLSKTITSFCGLRPVGSLGDFIINSPKKGFVNVAGIESPGLASSPAIAEYVETLLGEAGLVLKEKSDYNPNRPSPLAFSAASPEEKNRMIRENPAYGKIVCRCEGITEGEILDALRNNPKACSLDGVKRRTRAQMGRCQGGFCGPAVTELIAKERGIKLEDVTKNGAGANVLVSAIRKGENA